MTRLRIATGIDLPLAPSCGSMILCSDLYRALQNRATTDFFCLPPVDAEWQYGFHDLKICHSVKQPYGPHFDRYVERLTEEVGAHLRQGGYDVIHAQHLGYGLSLAFARARGTRPMVAIAHGTDVIEAMTSAQAREALCEVVEHSAVVVLPTVALSNHVDDLTNRRWTDKLTVVPWGIPLDRVAAHHRPRGGRTLNLLHAGRLDHNKSTVTALESLVYTERPHRLTIIGDGPELAALRQRATQWKLVDRVTFAPFCSRDVLWRQFAVHDAFLMTTSGLEAFGLVAVEAQAHGLPVLYSDVAGMSNTLDRGGLCYQPGDPKSLAVAIDTLANDPDTRAVLSRQAVRNASRFDLARTVQGIAAATERATPR